MCFAADLRIQLIGWAVTEQGREYGVILLEEFKSGIGEDAANHSTAWSVMDGPRTLWTTDASSHSLLPGLGPSAFARQFKTASDPGSLTGSERNKIASMKLKIAVFAPIPSARESTTS